MTLTNVVVDEENLQRVLIQKIGEKRANQADLIASWHLFSPSPKGKVDFRRFLSGLRLLGVETAPSSARKLFDSVTGGKKAFDFQEFVDRLLKKPKGSEVRILVALWSSLNSIKASRFVCGDIDEFYRTSAEV